MLEVGQGSGYLRIIVGNLPRPSAEPGRTGFASPRLAVSQRLEGAHGVPPISVDAMALRVIRGIPGMVPNDLDDVGGELVCARHARLDATPQQAVQESVRGTQETTKKRTRYLLA